LFKSAQFLRDQAFRPDIPIYFANHHEAHGLAALFYTDWDNALVYTGDGVGDNVSYSIRRLAAGRLDCFYGDDRWLPIPHPRRNSIAMAYGFATEACGFRRGRHEGKLTGLAAHGSPTLAGAISRHFRLDDDGLVAADFTSWHAMEKTIAQICHGHSREEIAASIQAVVEDLILRSVGHWLERTRSRNLALSGGLFSNVRLNRLLAESLPLDEIFVFPAMGDEGLAVGSALCFLRERDGLDKWLRNRLRLDHVYLGRDYGDGIDTCLKGVAANCPNTDNPVEIAVQLLRSGQIGAIYTGRMEYGPRALGARSIIASPVDPTITDELNRRLSRSEFMPFAPFVLAEDADHVFEITSRNAYTARFMTISCAVRPEWRERIAGVVHVDNTARPQILRDDDNPLFAAILRRFRDQTGIPVLINTSFNVHEEPIVNRSEECAKALIDGRIDFVITAKAVYTMND
jgi:carbamoyltransferase